MHKCKVLVKIEILANFGDFGRCIRGLRLFFEKLTFKLICILWFCVFCVYLLSIFWEIKKKFTCDVFYPNTSFPMLDWWEFYKLAFFSHFWLFKAIFRSPRHISKSPKFTTTLIWDRTRQFCKKNHENIQIDTVFKAKIALFSTKNRF